MISLAVLELMRGIYIFYVIVGEM